MWYWKIILPILLLSLVGFFTYQYISNKPIELDEKTYIEPIRKKEAIVNTSSISEFEKQIRKVDWKKVDAKSIYAFNPETGKVYFKKNINEKLPIASITKLATVLTASNLFEKDSNITVTQPLLKMDLPVGLKVGDTLVLNDLFKCTLISSNNDCANALAYEYGIEGFLKEMNNNATILGMKNTKFSNPTGFVNIDNYSTAYDLGILASAISRDSNIIKITDSISSSITINRDKKVKVGINATNVMLKESKYIKGLKTGFTFASGECLILFYDYGQDEKLISVVLDASDRFGDSRILYNLIIEAFN